MKKKTTTKLGYQPTQCGTTKFKKKTKRERNDSGQLE